MKSKIVWTIAIALMISMSLIAFSPIYGARPSRLTAEEVAFAEAVGVGDYAYEIDEIYAHEYGEFEWPTGSGLEAWRGAGSDAENAYADYLVAEMNDIGLENVEKEPFDVHAYHYGGAWVQVTSPHHKDKWLACGYSGLPGTTESPYADKKGSITAEIVYVGLGTKYDYEGKDVEGKLVLVDVSEEDMYWLQYPHYEAELHGAIGMVVTWVEYGLLEDSAVTHDSECRRTIPAVCISHKNADYLKNLIANSEDPVKVKIWCDAEVDLDGTSYNVYGYIPGTTYPDEYIIIGDHYDKHWYGASDDGSGVARLLGMAKAFVNSSYQPSRTLVFVAHGAEEYGWSDTEFAWAIGAWYTIYEQHPEWIGKTLAYFNCEGGGTIGATSVYAYGTPETQGFRSRLLPLFDEWFTNNDPWSAYYYPSSEWTSSFPSTWNDQINFGTAGIPSMEVRSGRSNYAGYDYHTQKDAMYGISAESLAMSIIANGIAAIELDRSVLIPYSFENRADDMKQYLEEELLTEAGINYRQIISELNVFRRVAAEATRLINSAEDPVNAQNVNLLLLQTADVLLSKLLWVGGYIQPFYPHQHYQEDSWYLREGIWALEEGNIDAALMWLSWTFNMWTGRFVSRETYQAMYIDRWNPERDDLFWGKDRLAKVIDIWDEYESLVQKKNDGITDYSEEIALLWTTYDTVVDNYKASVDDMMGTLAIATDLLDQVITQLK